MGHSRVAKCTLGRTRWQVFVGERHASINKANGDLLNGRRHGGRSGKQLFRVRVGVRVNPKPEQHTGMAGAGSSSEASTSSSAGLGSSGIGGGGPA